MNMIVIRYIKTKVQFTYSILPFATQLYPFPTQLRQRCTLQSMRHKFFNGNVVTSYIILLHQNFAMFKNVIFLLAN